MGRSAARGLFVVVVACAAYAALAGPALAGQLIDRNAQQVSLKVDAKGEAMLEYVVGVRHRHVLIWGAINSRAPVFGSGGKPNNVEFKVDYSGGWGSRGKVLYKDFKNVCKPYKGPTLAYLIKACSAPDGSNWAVQAWQSELPNLGFAPWIAKQSSWRLKISHWSGPLAKLEVYSDWVGSTKAHGLFGKFTYQGKPIFGFKSSRFGEPLDTYNRLIYLDTLGSTYGKGWTRENSFLPHGPNGNFCYTFKTYNPRTGGYSAPSSWPRGKLRGPGNGTMYRLSAVGPGVTPDIVVTIPGLHDYDASNPDDVAYFQQQAALAKTIAGSDKTC